MIQFHDIIGLTGAIIILIPYLLLQINKMSADGFSYSALNFIGALCILFSLLNCWNLTAFFIEIIWGSISVWGMIRWYKTTYWGKN